MLEHFLRFRSKVAARIIDTGWKSERTFRRGAATAGATGVVKRFSRRLRCDAE